MIKVLYFVDRLRRGGIQSLLYNMLCVIDPQYMSIEVLTLDDGEEYELEKNIKNLGITVHKLSGVWIHNVSDIPLYMKRVSDFFKENHDYDAVHLNSSSKNAWILHCARQYDIPVRIAHAHNTKFQTRNLIKIAVGNILKHLLLADTTHRLACSKIAGQWMFGSNKNVYIIPNGIISEHFAYRSKWRKELREEINVGSDCLLIGFVGRFTHQKNPKFMLKLAEKMKENNADFKIVMIGTGRMLNSVQRKAKKQGLDEHILFLGFREDRNRWYSAFDRLVIPSLYEGLPLTMIEAQTAGLPIVASDSITTEATISPLVQRASLSDPVEQWCRILKSIKKFNRSEGIDYVLRAGYDTQQMIDQLSPIYAGAV